MSYVKQWYLYLSTREVKSHLEKCGCLYYQSSVIGNTCKWNSLHSPFTSSSHPPILPNADSKKNHVNCLRCLCDGSLFPVYSNGNCTTKKGGETRTFFMSNIKVLKRLHKNSPSDLNQQTKSKELMEQFCVRSTCTNMQSISIVKRSITLHKKSSCIKKVTIRPIYLVDPKDGFIHWI